MNKNLLSQTIIFVCALLLVSVATFAWFAISKTAEAPVVGQVGEFTSIYEFGAVTETDITNITDISKLDLKDVMPGSKFTFAMIVESQGDSEGTISINFNNIASYTATPHPDDKTQYIVDDEYERPYEKIQYAFCYSVYKAYWVPSGTTLKDFDPNEPLDVIQSTWVEFTDAEKNQYYPTYDVDVDEIEGNDAKRFNNSKTSTTGSKIDQADYSLIKDVPVDSGKAFVVIFQIQFLNDPVLPDFLSFPDGYTFDGNIYGNQILGINSITIVSEKQ